MNESVPVRDERLPVLPPAGRHPGMYFPVEELQHKPLVLLQQLIRELEDDVQEENIRGRSRGIVNVLDWVDGEPDPVPVQNGDRLPISDRVEAEAQREPLRQLLNVHVFLALLVYPVVLPLQLLEQRDQTVHHGDRATRFVYLPRLSDRVFDYVPELVVVLDVVLENVRTALHGYDVVHN